MQHDDALKKHFGLSGFRKNQSQIIDSVLSGNDTFVLMPTGGGKSLCYQLPAMIMPGIAVVISPLISLMKDQVDSLCARGIQAAYVNSTQTTSEMRAITCAAVKGKYKFLYIAPERLTEIFIKVYLLRMNINLFAIDEAHCISQWGHEFRPSYRNLKRIKKLFPHVPIIGLTATATPETARDIVSQLAIPNAEIFVSSFDRPNLSLEVKYRESAFECVHDEIVNVQGSSIVYCGSRRLTEYVSHRLRQCDVNAVSYHAGMNKLDRQAVQDAFMSANSMCIVATVAFGMGINKSDIRLIVHYGAPGSVESYYQEIGRAGRDSKPSRCVMFWDLSDFTLHEHFIAVIRNEIAKSAAREKLNDMRKFIAHQGCKRNWILNYFGEKTHAVCGNCSYCMGVKQ